MQQTVKNRALAANNVAAAYAGRLGTGLIQAAVYTRALRPVSMLAVTLIALASTAFGAPSGTWFGQDSTWLSKMGDSIVSILTWGLLIGGICLTGWAVITFYKGGEKAVPKLVSGLAAISFGGVMAVLYDVGQGNQLNVNRDFSAIP